MMTNIYGNITTATELGELQKQAGEGNIGIGVTNAGACYKLDNFSAKEIKDDEVKELLCIDDKQLILLKNSRGTISRNELYSVEEPEVVDPEPKIEKEISEQTEIETNNDNVEVIDDPVAEDVSNEVHEPVAPKVVITEEEYNELLKVKEDNNKLNETLEKARKLNTKLFDELSEIKKAASVIANLIK